MSKIVIVIVIIPQIENFADVGTKRYLTKIKQIPPKRLLSVGFSFSGCQAIESCGRKSLTCV